MTNPEKAANFAAFFVCGLKLGWEEWELMGSMGWWFILPMNPILPTALDFLASRLLIAIVQPGFGHPLAQAALFDEFFLQRLQLLTQ